MCERLENKGIVTLYGIQAQTFQTVLDGKDLVGARAPVAGRHSLLSFPSWRRLTARAPFLPVAGASRAVAPSLPSSLPLASSPSRYTPISCTSEPRSNSTQSACMAVRPTATKERALRAGCDIAVGTPGRMKDHLERKTLSFEKLRFRVLDEADEMLNMGFVEDIETILNAAKDNDKLQTLLFSATLPKWVADIARRFLTPGYTTVDLVGDEKQKASGSVQHLLLSCQWSERTELVCDLIRAKVPGDGRVHVFCDTKRDCGELQEALQKELEKGAKALHGDVNQSQREVVLAGFRANKFQTLVATDVAARGLDISGVELVVQCEPPKEAETYIHRSGRTESRRRHRHLRHPLHPSQRVGHSQHRAQGRIQVPEDRPAPARGDGGGGSEDCHRAGTRGASGSR